MGILEKIKFWKREEHREDLPGTPMPGQVPQDLYGQKPPESSPFEAPKSPFETGSSPFEQPKSFEESLSVGPTTPPPTSGSKDLEMINLKLDAIKNTLESINLRLQRLEQAAGVNQR